MSISPPSIFDLGTEDDAGFWLDQLSFLPWTEVIGGFCNAAFLNARDDAGDDRSDSDRLAPFLSLHDQSDSAEEARQHGA